METFSLDFILNQKIGEIVSQKLKEHFATPQANPPPQAPQLTEMVYRIEETAKILKCKHFTIREYIKKNKLKATRNGKIWFITADAINEFLKNDR